jgi:putative flippase GtrA
MVKRIIMSRNLLSKSLFESLFESLFNLLPKRVIDLLYLPLIRQVFRFGVVGLTGACIHFSTVVVLVQYFSFLPLMANFFGFLCAFQISYWGHRLWTFRDTISLHRIAAPKLLVIQLLNFSANETLFYIFLSLHLPYPIALLIVLSVLPVFTFISSKKWVFKGS